MMVVEFRASCGSTVAANSLNYWRDGHAANGRKSAASALSARPHGMYQARTLPNETACENALEERGAFMNCPGQL